MRITLTEEAKKLIFPLYIQKTASSAKEVIYTSPGEMLSWMTQIDKKTSHALNQKKMWKIVAITATTVSLVYIYKNKKLKKDLEASYDIDLEGFEDVESEES